MTTPTPERPWQRVGTDLFVWEKETYLLIIDYFSRYIEVAHLREATANTVISALKKAWGRHGIPEVVMSDNGPQYACALFKEFTREYGFTHITSSPRNPQANGEAERAVATVKGLWKEGRDKVNALLSYRSTPLECGYSPSQLLMGRQLRTKLPQLPQTLVPRWPNIRVFRREERLGKKRQEQRYNRRHRARHLPDMRPGQSVWLPTENVQGTVIDHAAGPRSYVVRTDYGLLRRNRSHLRETYQPETHAVERTNDPVETENQADAVQPAARAQNSESTTYVTSSGRLSRPPNRLDL